MKVNSYRVEFNKIDGQIYRVKHFKDCIIAEEKLYQHSRELEDKANIMPTIKRYGFIYESHLVIY